MTMQILDKFIYKGDEYSLFDIPDGDFFSPDLYGMSPEMLSTACYRGFIASYELLDTGLYLRELTIRDKNQNYPLIGGVPPKLDYYRPFVDSSEKSRLEQELREVYQAFELTNEEVISRAETINKRLHTLENPDEDLKIRNAVYSSLNELINFSGQFRLAKNLVRKNDIVEGRMVTIVSFDSVLQIQLRNKWLVSVKDVTGVMKHSQSKFQYYDDIL